MARRGRPQRHEVAPDPKFNDPNVARLINRVMVRGQKATAQNVVYSALELVSKKGQKPLEVLNQAIQNVTPMVEVRPRRVGGATYQIPLPLRQERGFSLALRWLVGAARSKKGQPMAQRLANELLEAAQGQGTAVKRREDTHKMAEANKAFVHYRW